MTLIQIIALLWLALVFAISLWQHVNLGLIMLPAAYVLSEYAGVPLKELYAAFPIKLVILVLGVMYLWNHVQESGLAGIFVKKTVRLARGKAYLLPWAMAFLTAVICAIGALPAAALAITTPVAIEIAKREGIRSTLMGVVITQGACIGGFTPFNPWANVVASQAAKNQIEFFSGYFCLAQALLALAVGVIGFFCFGGLELLRRPALSKSAEAQSSVSDSRPLTRYQWSSLAGLVAFIALVLLKYDIGLTAFVIGMVLQIAFHLESKKAIAKLPWNIAIMIGGVLTYVGVLESLGVLHAIGDLLGGMKSPALVRYGISLLGTIIANFEASSVAVLGLVIPVAIKSMGADTSHLLANIQLALLSGSIAFMAASPFHIGGALILAEADNNERTFKELLIWVVSLTIVLPFLAFLL